MRLEPRVANTLFVNFPVLHNFLRPSPSPTFFSPSSMNAIPRRTQMRTFSRRVWTKDNYEHTQVENGCCRKHVETRSSCLWPWWNIWNQQIFFVLLLLWKLDFFLEDNALWWKNVNWLTIPKPAVEAPSSLGTIPEPAKFMQSKVVVCTYTSAPLKCTPLNFRKMQIHLVMY